MARAPRRGQAKTRLEPLLGPAGCARLQAALLCHTAHWAATVAPRVRIAFTPDDARAEVAELAPHGALLLAQGEGDLGVRLARAVERADKHDRLVIVGTDAPLLGPEHVRAAWRALRDGWDACIVPALDGGYALIALARPAPTVFDLPSAAWGGPQVLELTMAALHRARLSCRLLDPVADLDTPEDALAFRDDPRCPPAIRTRLRQGDVAA
ncbi:MAG: TIGR04282 family arsenosugar biosynthesis glycosyltransferase [Thermoleophilaceae bacterium]|nr:TIGR04282 family arsenosugar biosynthesis glycosyltransferase [Thermoleophilaceae bacterium]